MAEITERSTVTQDNYYEIVKMMLSNDEASTNLALTIMEQSDFDKSMIYIMCLLVETFPTVYGKAGPYTEFEEKYSKLHKNLSDELEDAKTNISTLSFEHIYQIAQKREVKGEIEFLLHIFKEELVNLLKDYNFGFLEYLDVEIKPKEKLNEPVA